MHKSGKLTSPLALKRGSTKGNDTYVILEDGVTIEVSVPLYNAKLGIGESIRILKEEYEYIDKTLKNYTHFNLQFGGMRVGTIYALPKILVQGYYIDDTNELPPLLSFDNTLVGMCVNVKEHVPYKAIHEDVFKYSMTNIKHVEELKKAILRRYRISMPQLSEEEILSLGVGITTLQIIK